MDVNERNASMTARIRTRLAAINGERCLERWLLRPYYTMGSEKPALGITLEKTGACFGMKKGGAMIILPRSGAFNRNRKNNEPTGNEKFLAYQENIPLKKHQGKESHARGMPNMAITPIIADSTPR